jgi:hypothetical protein
VAFLLDALIGSCSNRLVVVDDEDDGRENAGEVSAVRQLAVGSLGTRSPPQPELRDDLLCQFPRCECDFSFLMLPAGVGDWLLETAASGVWELEAASGSFPASLIAAFPDRQFSRLRSCEVTFLQLAFCRRVSRSAGMANVDSDASAFLAAACDSCSGGRVSRRGFPDLGPLGAEAFRFGMSSCSSVILRTSLCGGWVGVGRRKAGSMLPYAGSRAVKGVEEFMKTKKGQNVIKARFYVP